MDESLEGISFKSACENEGFTTITNLFMVGNR